ncbi:MAG: RNA-directed DNA polymerase [Clostridiales bacterium]|nr:RNA-directed DNA polymerase [Clostridiales bacterium]
MKTKSRRMAARSNGWGIEGRMEKLKRYICGWADCFKIAGVKSLLKETGEWMRRRIRLAFWRQWKRVRTKYERLQRHKPDRQKAWKCASAR